MDNVEKILEERGSRYGSMEINAMTTQALMRVIKNTPSYDNLSSSHIECIHMIFHKISRMVCGDPMYVDNAVDMEGYSRLLKEYIENKNAKNS